MERRTTHARLRRANGASHVISTPSSAGMKRRIDHCAIASPATRDFVGRLKMVAAWVYPRIRPFRWMALSSWLMVTLLSGASTLPILLARRIVQDLQSNGEHLPFSLAGLAATILGIGGLRFTATYLFSAVSLRLRHNLEEEYARRLATVPLSYYESNSSASLALAPFNQIPLLARVGEVILRNFLQAATTLIFALVVLFHISPSIGFCCALLAPFFLLVPHVLSHSVERRLRQTFLRVSEMHSCMLESLLCVKTIRTLGLSERRVQDVRRIADETLREERSALLLAGLMQFMMDVVFAAGTVTVLVLLQRRLAPDEGSLAIGAAALAGFMLLAREGRILAMGVLELRRTLGACDQVVRFLEQPLPAAHDACGAPDRVESITVDRVRFSYDGSRNVLQDVSMVCARGQITGIVGQSGSGKSTLVDLLLRLRTPEAGRILVNDLDLGLLSEPWLRKTMAFVDQEPYLLNISIRENLLLGAPGLDDRALESVLAAASALDAVRALPRGLDTVVGEGGSLLSVGEKQRIALARALAVGPSVIVLDEITSALDPENERAILQTLRELKPGRIIILISHRERVSDVCDAIYRIEEGRAVQVREAAGEGSRTRG